MRRAFCLPSLLLLVCALGVPVAYAADPFAGSRPTITELPVPFPSGHITAQDGRGTLLFGTADGVRKLNVLTGETHLRPLPAPSCRTLVASIDTVFADCTPYDGSLGLRDVYVGSWASDSWRRVPAFPPSLLSDKNGNFYDVAVLEVGRHWLRAEASCYHCDIDVVYLSLDDGHAVHDTELGARFLPDLDKPGLGARMCAPFTKRGLLQYQRPWAIYKTGRNSRLRYELRHCGSSRPRKTSRTPPQLDGRWLEWDSGYTAYAHDLGTGRTQSFACTDGCGGLTWSGNLATWYAYNGGYVRDLARRRTINVTVPGHHTALSLLAGRVLATSTAPGLPAVTGVVQLPR